MHPCLEMKPKYNMQCIIYPPVHCLVELDTPEYFLKNAAPSYALDMYTYSCIGILHTMYICIQPKKDF